MVGTSHGDLALESGADILAVAEHRLSPAQVSVRSLANTSSCKGRLGLDL